MSSGAEIAYSQRDPAGLLSLLGLIVALTIIYARRRQKFTWSDSVLLPVLPLLGIGVECISYTRFFARTLVNEQLLRDTVEMDRVLAAEVWSIDVALVYAALVAAALLIQKVVRFRRRKAGGQD